MLQINEYGECFDIIELDDENTDDAYENIKMFVAVMFIIIGIVSLYFK